MLIIKSRERENKMNVRVIKDADGVAQNMVASLGVTGLSLPADKNTPMDKGDCYFFSTD